MGDLRDYARLRARLDRGEETRSDILADAGLHEDGWGELESKWEAALSHAMNAESPGDLLASFTQWYAEAQAELATAITLEQLAQVTRLIGVHGDVGTVLEGLGLRLADYLHGQRHWGERMTRDPGMAARFQGLVAGVDSGENAVGPDGGHR